MLRGANTVLAGIALLTAACGEKAPEFLNLAPDVGYVGRDACRPCHFEMYASYAATGMGRSLYPLTADVVVEDFSDDNQFVVEATGLHYRMEQRDGRYYQRQFHVDSRGREIAMDERELLYAIGSNNHSRGYVTFVNDKWFQAPICWYPEPETWDLCPGFEKKNDHFSRELSQSCLFCHNGRMVRLEGQRNAYEEPYPHGIGCERCHGPGQLHVERWSDRDATPRGEADATIVHPRRLSREARLEVCLQCHLGDSKATQRVVRHGTTPGEEFRPGHRLSDIIVPFRYRQPTHYDFGLSAQGDRLMLSRCFTESEGRLECLTCHNPHVTVYHESRPADSFRRRCVGCHTIDDCSAPKAERAATELEDDCVACHMRRAEPDDQRYTRFTDHWIRRDIEIAERDHRTSFDIEPVLADSHAALPTAERTYYRARARQLLATNAPAAARTSLLTAAASDFEGAIADGFDEVDAWYYLGKSRLELGRFREALDAFRRVVEMNPEHHDGAFALGQGAFAAGDRERARAIFGKMTERRPDDPMALAEAGRTALALGRSDEALEFYERAIRLEPWNASLHLNLGLVLASRGRYDEALERSLEAVRLDPDDTAAWEFYVKIHEQVGRAEDAREGRRLLGRLRGGRG